MATVEQAVGGISFALTDEQKELRALSREFAERRSGRRRPSTTSTRRTRST